MILLSEVAKCNIFSSYILLEHFVALTDHANLTQISMDFILVDDIITAFKLSPEEFQTKYGSPKPKVTDENLIFHCQSGRRAKKAVERVQQLGFEK